MPRDEEKDWRTQLQQLRGSVEEMERQRAEEERLKLERSRESLEARLKKDTTENLAAELQQLRKECDRAARRFYPVEAVEGVLGKLGDFDRRMQFYQNCQKQFGDLFTERARQSIRKSQESVAKTQRGLERQVRQWREIREALEGVGFRTRSDQDDEDLVRSAVTFSETAHGMGLAIPTDFFAGENEEFHVVTYQDRVIGHIKYWPDRQVVTFALTAPDKINFAKFVRGVLYRAYRSGPLADKAQSAVRARLSMNKEVKFFTDLGFVRAETVSVSEWIYERPLD